MRLLLVAALLLFCAPQAARAADHEPQIYFFWAASCPYCQATREFLANAKAQDPRLQVREFEVEDNLGNVILFSRVYERIGMPGFGVVPLVIVGTHVIIGFDEAAAREILDSIGDCRKRACHDIVRDLIREPRDAEHAALAAFIARPQCRGQPPIDSN